MYHGQPESKGKGSGKDEKKRQPVKDLTGEIGLGEERRRADLRK